MECAGASRFTDERPRSTGSSTRRVTCREKLNPGNLDERRVVWSTGRDLVLDPPAAAGPVNHMVKAHVEVDGKPLAENNGWTRKLTFRQVR